MDTNKLTKQINTMLRPRAALIAYSTDGGDTYFLEVRNIDNEGVMSEGRPVTVDFINELIKGYSERHSSTPHGLREIYLVQPATKAYDVLQGVATY